MVHPIADKLKQEREKLLAVVSELTEEALERRRGDGWSIRELLTHLCNAEEDHCRVISVVARGQSERLPTALNLDEHNERRLAERGHLTREQLLVALAEQRVKTEALLEKLTAEQLELKANHPALGEITLGKIFRIIGLHERMHQQDIAAALKDDGDVPR
ncbi:MAG: DinB family protein [Ardenticatenales bacterium]|nr:DinB family protein [Ardenticatenales bacterium]